MKRPMGNSVSGLFSDRDTSRHFLLNRSKRGQTTEKEHAPDDRSAPFGYSQKPSPFGGNAFVQHAMQRLQAVPAFAAMVIRQDENHSAAAAATDSAEDIADKWRHLMEEVFRERDGYWGKLDACTIGCFVAGIDARGCMELGRQIQHRLRREIGQTVSIGMALFPTCDYTREDMMDNASKALMHAGFFGPDSAVIFDAVSLNISGDAFYQEGHLDHAISEFQKALKLEAENVNVLNSLGVCYGVKGELEKALDAFQAVIALDADHVMALYNAGYVHALMDRNEQALSYFLAAKATGEKVFEVRFQIGKLYLDMGQPAKAEPFLQQALEILPDSGVTCFHLAECSQAMGNKDRAIMYYETAVKKNPNDAASLSALGALYDEKGENSEISTMFCEKSVEMSPENGLFHFRLGCVYANHGKPDKALNVFENAVKLGFDASAEMEKVKQCLTRGVRARLSN